MRLYEAHVIKATGTGRDVLGNPTVTEQDVGTILVRPTPMTPTLDTTEGNQAHYIERLLITRAPAGTLAKTVALIIDGRRFEVIHVAMAGVTLIRCRESKEGKWAQPSL